MSVPDELNKSMEELSAAPEESLFPGESVSPSEQSAYSEITSDDEDNRNARDLNYSGEDDDSEKDKDDSDDAGKGSGSSAGAGGGMAGIAGVGAVAVVAVVLVLTAVSGIKAFFNKLDVFGNSFNYDITVTMDYEKTEDDAVDFENIDTGIILAVTKNNFSKNIKLVTGGSDIKSKVTMLPVEGEENKYKVTINFVGTCDGLNENTRYRLAIIGDEDGKTVTYATDEIKTTARTSEFKGISSHCTCDRDGFFNFTVNYLDENGFYSDFAYEFRSPDNETVRSGVIEEPDKEQHIQDVNQLKGSDYILVITFRSAAATDVAADNKTEKIGNITVTINQGAITIVSDVRI